MKRFAPLVLPMLLVAACGNGDGPAQQPDAGEPGTEEPTAVPRVEDASCRYQVPAQLGLSEGSDYRCGDLIVHENRAIEGGPIIRLHYIQIDGMSSDVATIYLDGGPGGDGASILGALASGESGVADALLAGGDFLSISQRGTGLSQPALHCSQNNPSAQACGTALSPIADLPSYNTAANADDIEDLRRVLGYRALNLYGISYGSRLTLEILRRHPSSVRAAIAGGTVPSHIVWPAETPASFHGAVAELAASCNADEACAAAYGDLEEVLLGGIESLNEEPVTVSVFGQQFPLDGNTYAALVFQLLYSRASYGILPLVITDLPEGRTDRVLQPLLDIFGGGGPGGQLARGMYFSVVCGEIFNPAPPDSVFDDATANLPAAILDAMGGNWFQLQSECANWPVGRPLPELAEIVTSDVPTLLSNGQLDPITPPRFGSFAKEGLVNAQVVSFANSGHGSTLQSACGVKVLGQFLADPESPVDASCALELDIEFELPSAAAPFEALDIERIRRDIERAPTPPWIQRRLDGWAPR